MKAPRKPKALKAPKRPRQSASVETWKRFEKRVKDVKAENAKRLRDWETAKRKIESDKKLKASIISRTRK